MRVRLALPPAFRKTGQRSRSPCNYAGQVLFLLDNFRGCAPVSASATGPVRSRYSPSSSFLSTSICSLSKCVTRTERQRSDARIIAPNISFRTALSPQALGMIFRRRRSSTNSRSRRLVVRIARRWFTGIRRWAMQASKSSRKQATALESGWSKPRSFPIPRSNAYQSRARECASQPRKPA